MPCHAWSGTPRGTDWPPCFASPRLPRSPPLVQYPALPEPVMDKLLALEANELDMVLQYPAATRVTVGGSCMRGGRLRRRGELRGRSDGCVLCPPDAGAGAGTCWPRTAARRPNACVHVSVHRSSLQPLARACSWLASHPAPPPCRRSCQVERLLGVYQGQGADALESYSVPLLSWEDLQTIREGDGTDVPALPPAQQQEVRRLEAGGSAAPAAQAGEESQKQDGGGGDASATGVLPAAEAAAAATHDASATAAGGMHGAHTVEAAPANDDDAASCSLDGGSDGAASEADSIDLEDLYALD